MGWGLLPRARWSAFDVYDPRSLYGQELRSTAGNFMWSTGSNRFADRETPAHLDVPMRNCTVGDRRPGRGASTASWWRADMDRAAPRERDPQARPGTPTSSSACATTRTRRPLRSASGRGLGSGRSSTATATGCARRASTTASPSWSAAGSRTTWATQPAAARSSSTRQRPLPAARRPGRPGFRRRLLARARRAGAAGDRPRRGRVGRLLAGYRRLAADLAAAEPEVVLVTADCHFQSFATQSLRDRHGDRHRRVDGVLQATRPGSPAHGHGPSSPRPWQTRPSRRPGGRGGADRVDLDHGLIVPLRLLLPRPGPAGDPDHHAAGP